MEKYTSGLLILVPGMFACLMSEILEAAVGKVRVPWSDLPHFNGQR